MRHQCLLKAGAWRVTFRKKPAFRFTEYDFFKRWVMKLIAWDKGVRLEPGKDLELTNWDALSTTVDAMRARFAGVKTKKTA